MGAKLYKRGFKMPHRFRPGKIALKQIRKYQKAKDYRNRLRCHTQIGGEAAEAFLMGLFENLSLCSVHANKSTIKPKDLQLARLLRHKRS